MGDDASVIVRPDTFHTSAPARRPLVDLARQRAAELIEKGAKVQVTNVQDILNKIIPIKIGSSEHVTSLGQLLHNIEQATVSSSVGVTQAILAVKQMAADVSLGTQTAMESSRTLGAMAAVITALGQKAQMMGAVQMINLFLVVDDMGPRGDPLRKVIAESIPAAKPPTDEDEPEFRPDDVAGRLRNLVEFSIPLADLVMGNLGNFFGGLLEFYRGNPLPFEFADGGAEPPTLPQVLAFAKPADENEPLFFVPGDQQAGEVDLITTGVINAWLGVQDPSHFLLLPLSRKIILRADLRQTEFDRDWARDSLGHERRLKSAVIRGELELDTFGRRDALAVEVDQIADDRGVEPAELPEPIEAPPPAAPPAAPAGPEQKEPEVQDIE